MTAYSDANELLQAEGEDGVRRFMDASWSQERRAEVAASPRPRFRAWSESELDLLPAPEWLIEDVLPAGALVSVYGHYGSGKSFFTLDMARCIETGALWRGRLVRQGLVIYIAAEGGTGFRMRLKAFREAHPDLAYGAFRLITACPDLGKKAGDLAELVKDIHAASSALGETPALIVIDTLAQTLAGENENGEGMTSFVFNCQGIQTAFPGATVIAVHHVGHEGTRPRGHSSFMGALDMAMVVRADPESGDKHALVTKMKDGADGERFDFRLKVEEVGLDAGGKAVTSCSVEHTFTAASAPATVKPLRRANIPQVDINANVVLQAGQNLRDKAFVPPPEVRDNLVGTMFVPRDALKAETYALGFEAEASEAARKRAFSRAILRLCGNGEVSQRDEWVCLDPPP